MTPAFLSVAWKVVATETLSNTASTATLCSPPAPSAPSTPARIARSFSGMPSFSYILRSSGSTSSSDFGPAALRFGAA